MLNSSVYIRDQIMLMFCLCPSGGLTQRTDAGAEVGHSAEAAGQHTGSIREQLAGTSYIAIEEESIINYSIQMHV